MALPTPAHFEFITLVVAIVNVCFTDVFMCVQGAH